MYDPRKIPKYEGRRMTVSGVGYPSDLRCVTPSSGFLILS